jgi:hypothetical protein
MTDSKRIAGLLGPVLIALSLSEALNLRLLTSEIGPRLVHLVYLNGTLLFVAGVSIIRVHNRWTRSWPVLVTLTGWFSTLLGLVRMFAPLSGAQLGLDVSQPEENFTAIFALLVILLPTGIVLTVKAYPLERRPL